jgi:hypothetical protein
VLLMLTRTAGCIRVTKEYELVCKLKISVIVRSGDLWGYEDRPLG